MTPLRLATGIVGVAWLVLLSGIVYASSRASLMDGMADLLNDPWGIVTLIDIYVGGVVIAVWISLREQNKIAAALWIVAFLGLGHFISATYFLYRAMRARTLPDVFLAPVDGGDSTSQ